ncbi:MAG: STAS domain-containing protein [Cyclobacteriaceae bacterium]|nr:STAS domain-containing protein [Cyclobacteriaceae bacterium]
MKYTIDKHEKYMSLTLHEEKLDASIAPNLKAELITFHAEGVRNIILDLNEVKYTDSSGLSALLVGNRIVQEDGGVFVLSCLSEHTSKLIKISQLDSVLNIVETVEEAIDAIFIKEIENGLKGEGNNE